MSASILEAKGVVKRYGKFAALTDVNLRIARNTVHSVIGPNGAGKTTLFHVLTGTVPITAGNIVFDGHDVTQEPDHRRVKRGIARSFQVTSLFTNLSVRENLRLAAQGVDSKRALNAWTPPRGALEHRDTVDGILERLALQRLASTQASALSHGQQRRLEVGMALAARPKAIFLDEPTSGMGIDDLDDMKHLIRSLRDDYTVVLIEHNMDIVMDISDIITVMQQGRVLVEGKPADIRGDERVRSAYLGNMITGGRA
ncbi:MULTISPECIES: ABC transporter ATP-binding protein [Caballeronia]|jgi:branched-chain amino acid transport system ATP-binding protein|uniref:ABC transporter n=1 Tax=Caballeronia zhejiangensis TaxID=871203 RepID=A0A656QQA7_9BURK|nr:MULTISPECIES: ABC transporter ATP-binding protein [Caballeronia]EKS69797.1 ABC transporter [Burkholderia sp. SJ98]KDR32475.1 ABC transporter [Caballeronia zhejiangensis]MCG7401204.1 ABC transporter ATP-binding protein [Caballeronia zhejiangensis]MCI1044495.1 ABC transporter ATP-binding protein [Caballeronia zhejiangensis]MDR5767390.1 ABC transporter ATP-binding protein [Caballeronia sp. LZ028]